MKMRYGTNSSTLIHSLYLRFVSNYIFNSTGSFASIFNAMPKFNFLVCSGLRTKLPLIGMMLFVFAANHRGAASGQHITCAVSVLALADLQVR